MGWIFALVVSLNASAEVFDFYKAYATKGSFCTVVGGACAADPDFDSGFFQNPASLTASRDNFDFDFDLNLDGAGNLEPGTNSYDSATQHSWMAAIAYRWGRIAAGVSTDHQIYNVTTTAQWSGGTLVSTVHAREESWNFPLSYRWNDNLFLGAALTAFTYLVQTDTSQPLTFVGASQSAPSLAWSLGGIYSPHPGLWVGGWLRLPFNYHFAQYVSGANLQVADNEVIAYPLQIHTGATWKPAQSSITYLFQVDVIGTTPGGELSSFDALSSALNQTAQPAKGRNLAIDPHLGLRGPIAERWNYYVGGYFASSRVEGIGGVAHGTGGISYRLPLPYGFLDALEFMAGLDVARDYTQVLLTFR
jgi:hypothetical protein